MKSENIVEFIYETDSGFVISIPLKFETSVKVLMQKAAQKAIDALAPFIKSPPNGPDHQPICCGYFEVGKDGKLYCNECNMEY